MFVVTGPVQAVLLQIVTSSSQLLQDRR